jgi:hypothetical protein
LFLSKGARHGKWNTCVAAGNLADRCSTRLRDRTGLRRQPASGRICLRRVERLIGLGFILNADGSYTDLDRKTSGRVSFKGSSVKFIGGHLDGYVGTGVSGSTFQIHGTGCSHN